MWSITRLTTLSSVVAVAVLAVLRMDYSSSQSQSMEMRVVRASNGLVDLTGKRAVVVGGTSGIGKGLALRLAKAGASVTIVGRSQERAANIIQQMQQQFSGW